MVTILLMFSAEDLLGTSLAVPLGQKKWKLTWPCFWILKAFLQVLVGCLKEERGQDGVRMVSVRPARHSCAKLP